MYSALSQVCTAAGHTQQSAHISPVAAGEASLAGWLDTDGARRGPTQAAGRSAGALPGSSWEIQVSRRHGYQEWLQTQATAS